MKHYLMHKLCLLSGLLCVHYAFALADQDSLEDNSIATKAAKHYTSLLVRNDLSSGSLYVGGDVIINHNLTVNNDETIGRHLTVIGNETIQGNLNVLGTTTFTSTGFTIAGNQTINGNLTVNGTTTTNGLLTTGSNTLTGPTNINTTGTATTIIGNATGQIFFPTGLSPSLPGDVFLALDSSTGQLRVDAGTTTPGVIFNNGQVGPLTIGTTNASGITLVTNGNNNVRLAIDSAGNVNIPGAVSVGSLTSLSNVLATTGLTAGTTVTAGTGLIVTSGGAQITGATNINSTGAATTNIGSSASTNTIQGTTNDIGNTFMSGSSGVVLTVTGNTTAPSTVLVGSAGATTAPALRLINNPPSSVTDFALTIDAAGNVKQTTTSVSFANFIINGGQQGPLTIGTTNASTMTFVTNNVSRVSFDQLGDTIITSSVGIGPIFTTAHPPITQLEVAGSKPFSVAAIATSGVGPTSVYVQGRYAYVVYSTSGIFQVFDVSTPTAPFSVGTVSIAGGADSVYVQGHYAYVANYGNGRFIILDISDPAAPLVVNGIGTSTGGLSVGPSSVYVQGRYAYITNSITPNLVIFDVYNPSTPMIVGAIATNLTNPQTVYVQGRYAYIADNGNSRLVIFDISNPTAPSFVNFVSISAAYSVYVQGRYAYVVSNNNSGNTVFTVVDIANPTSPQVVATLTAGLNAPQSVYVQGRYAYVTNYSSNMLTVIDVSTPANPTIVNSAATGTNPSSVFIQGRYGYVTNSGSSSMQIFDLGGAYIQQLEAGGIEVGTLQTRENMTVNNDLDVKGGTTIGSTLNVNGNVAIGGNVSVSGNSYSNTGTFNTLNANNGTIAAATINNLTANVAQVSQLLAANVVATNSVITSTATFANFVPTYAPLTQAMAGTVNFFGDSITEGYLLPSPTTQRWPTLVCNYFGSTQANYAVPGSQVNDSISQIYQAYPPGTNRTSFEAFGINDIRYSSATDNIYDEFRRTTEAMTLFICLPDSQKVNARNATTTGTWTNATQLGNWGLQTSTSNSTLSATVTGRFVCFSVPCVTNTILWDVTIDGVPIITAQPVVHNSPTTQNGANINEALWFYDTGSSPSTTHTILINYNSGASAPGYIGWLAGFNMNNANCNTVFIVSTTIYNFYQSGIGGTPGTGSEAKRQCWTEIQQSICRRYRKEYGLPVYFVDMSYPWMYGMIDVDLLHPNTNGHQYMANRAINVVLNGEYNYLT